MTESEMQDWSIGFDSVVMLTWSDWSREPRSNRYHYATRFSQQLPVFFVQVDGEPGKISTEKIDGFDITIVHVSGENDGARNEALDAFLRSHGVRRPLLWIYNFGFETFIAKYPSPLRVYHATEDYFGEDGPIASDEGRRAIAELGARVVRQCDLVVAVTPGVADNVRSGAQFRGQILVAENGCDTSFWLASGAHQYVPPIDGSKVVFYQGALNGRLDYELLIALAERMPDWQFQYCGQVRDNPAGWEKLRLRRNVKYLGELQPEGIAAAAKHALVGIIPFKDAGFIRLSLPLKAYEYVACGLPVVSVPIDALATRPDLFTIARGVDETASAISDVATTRCAEQEIARRLEAAGGANYDLRFETVTKEIAKSMGKWRRRNPRLNILMLFDEKSLHVKTIQEHLDAFGSYSHHRYFFLPATGYWPDDGSDVDWSAFDAIAIHYSVRLSIPDHIGPKIAASIRRFLGLKLLFIQDEYDTTETARRWIETLGIHAVFTNVPLASIDHVYPRARFPGVDFVPTLTGYVPEDPDLDDCVLDFDRRNILIGYRGRRLPHQYGKLGYDKYRIGVEVKRLAVERGLAVDIEVDDSRRIYGVDWYKFLGSCRATLGTESGCNLFDDDGSFSVLAAKHAHLDFQDFAAQFLPNGEGPVQMNQVSPKIFEAIRLRTALILFEGRYSDVVSADRHYIPMAHDFSNIDEVFEKIHDESYLRALIDRAYEDVIKSGRYALSHFVASVDRYVSERAGGNRKAVLVSTPVCGISEDGSVRPVQACDPHRFVLDQAMPDALATEILLSAAIRDVGAAMFGPPVSHRHDHHAPETTPATSAAPPVEFDDRVPASETQHGDHASPMANDPQPSAPVPPPQENGHDPGSDLGTPETPQPRDINPSALNSDRLGQGDLEAAVMPAIRPYARFLWRLLPVAFRLRVAALLRREGTPIVD